MTLTSYTCHRQTFMKFCTVEMSSWVARRAAAVHLFVSVVSVDGDGDEEVCRQAFIDINSARNIPLKR